MPRIPKPANQLRKELATLSLSVEDVSGMFGVSLRSVRTWTAGTARVPGWLVPSLKIYAMVPVADRPAVRKALGQAEAEPVAKDKPATKRPRAKAAGHPFARIEEL